MNPLSFLLYRATLKLTSLYWVKVILQRWVEFFNWMVWLSFNFYVPFISCIHYFIVILSWVYNQPAQWPAPSRLVSSIYCRALYRFKGQGLESCTSPFFFSGSLFATAEVASTTVMISFYLILDPAVHLYSYFIVLHLLEFPLAGMIFRTYFNCAITYFLNWMKYLL